MQKINFCRICLFATLIFLRSLTTTSYGQEVANDDEGSVDDLAQKLQNPLASITAIPIQYTFGFGSTQTNRTAFQTSFQPLMAKSYAKFNMIHRAVFGIAYVPGIIAGVAPVPIGEPENGEVGETWGVTDLNYSFFLSPKEINKVAWGIGPSITLPTSSDNRLGTGKVNLGGSVVGVYQAGRWTIDIIARQTWSIVGDSERVNVNQFVGQFLIAYGLGNGWVVNTFPTITANWDFEKGQQWTVPLGGGINKLVILGKLPVNLAVHYYDYTVRPDLAPKSELRFQTTFVLSK